MTIKRLIFLSILPFCLISISLESIENSIIPAIEKFEQIANLPQKKFSKNQFLEISSALAHKDERIRLVSYNMLFDLHDDEIAEVNRWPQRLPRIVELLNEMQPDIINIQELQKNQVQDLMAAIDGTSAFYSTGYDKGELNGILYRKERFKVVSNNVWSMTNTPNVPSAQTLTMIQLQDVKTGKCFAVFNTHLSFSKVDKREFQARFIADRIEPFIEQMPCLFTGDLNTFPNRMDQETLPFYDGEYIHRILTKKGLHDAKEVSAIGHLGPISTFSNDPNDTLPFQGTGSPGVFLDHIYVTDTVTVLVHAVQPGTVEGHYPSDHLPILIDFTL